MYAVEALTTLALADCFEPVAVRLRMPDDAHLSSSDYNRISGFEYTSIISFYYTRELVV